MFNTKFLEIRGRVLDVVILPLHFIEPKGEEMFNKCLLDKYIVIVMIFLNENLFHARLSVFSG